MRFGVTTSVVYIRHAQGGSGCYLSRRTSCLYRMSGESR